MRAGARLVFPCLQVFIARFFFVCADQRLLIVESDTVFDILNCLGGVVRTAVLLLSVDVDDAGTAAAVVLPNLAACTIKKWLPVSRKQLSITPVSLVYCTPPALIFAIQRPIFYVWVLAFGVCSRENDSTWQINKHEDESM